MVATKQGLEGIVSKKATQQYVSGKNVGWIKVKTATWREANRNRYEMFQGGEGGSGWDGNVSDLAAGGGAAQRTVVQSV